MFDREEASRNRNADFADQRRSVAMAPGIVGVVDVLIMLACAAFMYRYFVIYSDETLDRYISTTFFVILMSVFLFNRAGLYDFDAIMRPIRYSDAVIAGMATAVLFFLSIAISLDATSGLSIRWLLGFTGSSIVLVVASRAVAYLTLKRMSRSNAFGRTLVIYGDGEQARRFLSRIADVKPYFTFVRGVYADREDGASSSFEGLPVLGGTDRLLRDVRAGWVDDIVIALPWNEDQELARIVERLKELPVNVHIASDLVGFRLRFRPVLGSLQQLSMFEVERRPIAGWSSVLKAAEDYLLAGAALLALSPLLLIVAAAIKIDDPKGPIFFKQKRLGFNNQPFDIYKFRSMYHNRPDDGVVIQAKKRDPRVTRVGRIIRVTSIDELPQLLNVLNGTMSLVGPRPHAIDHNEEYGRQIRGYFTRHKVKPGITGWAQVNGLRGETEEIGKMEARIRHDIHYAENWSLLFDLRILVLTLVVVLFQRSAY